MTAPQPTLESAVGRREYDKLQSDYLAVMGQLNTVLQKLTAIETEMKSELTAVRSENKELLDFWKTAKGVNSFILWLSKFLIGAGVITAFFKWGPLK